MFNENEATKVKWNGLHALNELQHHLQKLVSIPSFLVFSFVTACAFVVF